MDSVPYLKLVYSSNRSAQGFKPMVLQQAPRTLRTRVQDSLSNTPVTYAATSTCASLALGSLDRLRDKVVPPGDMAWSGMADKAVLAIFPLTLSMCVATDAAALATYPWRLWKNISR